MFTEVPGRLATISGIAIAFMALALAGTISSPPRSVYATPGQPKLAQPDLACRSCHAAIYDTYQRTPMAQASGLAVDSLDLPDHGTRGFRHEPSGVTYRVSSRDGQPLLTFDRPSTPARSGLQGEFRLESFIGSGKRGRTFLYQAGGLWFEVPINWYGRKQLWDMAPAYEDTKSMPGPLPVDTNCLHCHAGDVQASAPGARNRFPGTPFRAAGIGCASCHGDASAHLAGAAAGKPGPILNPSHLQSSRRDAVCLQCHLEGDAAVYLPGKSLAAFLPGDDLSASVVYFVDRNRAQLGGRASSQFEALLRSACKRAVGEKLTCTTCHDPHLSPAPEQRVAFFRARCLACHTSPAIARTHHPEQQDCAACHMPTRKTLDISHEQLTDHDIEARPAAASLAEARLRAPDLVPVGNTPVSPRETGLAYAQLAQHGNRAAGERALTLLRQALASGADDPELHDQLGFLLQLAGSAAAATSQYRAALQQNPSDTTAAANLAVLEARSGQTGDALRHLQQVVDADPSQTAAGLNLAFLQCRLGRKAEAIQLVRFMLQFNPDSPDAHRFLESGYYGGQSCPLR